LLVSEIPTRIAAFLWPAQVSITSELAAQAKHGLRWQIRKARHFDFVGSCAALQPGFAIHARTRAPWSRRHHNHLRIPVAVSARARAPVGVPVATSSLMQIPFIVPVFSIYTFVTWFQAALGPHAFGWPSGPLHEWRER
jgi:hypothetical protein